MHLQESVFIMFTCSDFYHIFEIQVIRENNRLLQEVMHDFPKVTSTKIEVDERQKCFPHSVEFNIFF